MRAEREMEGSGISRVLSGVDMKLTENKWGIATLDGWLLLGQQKRFFA